MRFDCADSGNYLIHKGDSLIGHCSCAQAQLSISIGQHGKVLMMMMIEGLLKVFKNGTQVVKYM